MAAVPRGTVTLLFTDVEGSTSTLQKLGRVHYSEALTEHRHLLRDAFVRHGGVEVGTDGDSFFFAFPYARDALAAAAEAQRALARHEWPVAPLSVRIGIHTGEPMEHEGNYAGLDVHRAARVMSVGHGGQVLLSERTADIVDGELEDGLALRLVGRHRLKDLEQPMRIYQLLGEGLRTDFPPLKSLESLPDADRRVALLLRGKVFQRTAAALVVIAIVALLTYFGTRPNARAIIASPNSVALVDPANNHVVSVIPVGTTPTTIISGAGAVWTLNTGEQTISRIDASTRERTRTVSAGAVASDIAFADGAIWVADAATDTVSILDESGAVETTIRLDIHHRRSSFVTPRIVLASGGGQVWATGGDLTTEVMDAATRRITRHITGFSDVSADRTPAGPDIAVGKAGVWSTDGRDELYRVDATPAESVQLGGFNGDAGIEGVAVGTDVVWAAGAGVVWHVRAQPARPLRTYPVGAGAAGVALGADSVWTANAFDGTVSRIDIDSGQTTTITVGGTPTDLIFANGLVWVTIA